MAIAEGCLETITRTTRAGPVTTLVLIGRDQHKTLVYIINIRKSSSDPAWDNVYRLVLFFYLGDLLLILQDPAKISPPPCRFPASSPRRGTLLCPPTFPTVLASGLALPHGAGVSVFSSVSSILGAPRVWAQG